MATATASNSATPIENFPLAHLDQIVNKAVSDTFKAFFNVDVDLKTKEPLHTKKLQTYDISGNVGFVDSEKTLCGSLTIACSNQTLSRIVQEFYGQNEMSQHDRRMTDALGEITNVVHGLIRRSLSDCGYNYGMCLPIIVIGTHHCVFDVLVDSQVAFTFETVHGPLNITFNFGNAKH